MNHRRRNDNTGKAILPPQGSALCRGGLLLFFLFAWLGLPGAATASQAHSTHSPQQNRLSPVVSRSAPSFTLRGADGKQYALSRWRGHPVVLYFFCGCKWCRECAEAWGQLQQSHALPAASSHRASEADAALPQTVVIYSGSAEEAQSFATQCGLDPKQTLSLPDPTLDVTIGRYQAEPCPRVFVVDGKGILRYTNNHKEDAPRKAPADVIVAHALTSLLACGSETSKQTPKKPKNSKEN